MGRSIFAPLSLIFLAASIVFLFFVILAGETPSSPFKSTYFLSADTSGISGARPVSQWTYLRICGEGNTDCSRAWPDPPVGWAWSKDPTGPNLPEKLIGSYGNGTTSYTLFYLWRFGWAIYLLALLSSIVTFFTSFLGFCGRIGSAVAGLAAAISFSLLTIAAVLMTVTFVKMRNQFLAVGRDASIGVYAFGFTWAAWALLFTSTILFCLRSFAKRAGSGAAPDAGGNQVKEEYP
ncbi:SUR7/PalI family-domain-containing protein [Xylaria nigripes]|nr:SUR7/PalI family-domain-containing protein [Xylaria nigripes]